MEAGLAQVQGYEQRNVTAPLKVEAWQRFVQTFAQDNPYSTRDDDLRRQAQEYIKQLNRERFAGYSDW